MATNNFVEFDSAKSDILTDQEYADDTQRVNGVSTGLARTSFHNKLYRQLSVMVAAIGQVIADLGTSVSDTSVATLVTAFKNTILMAVNHTLSTDTATLYGLSSPNNNVDAAFSKLLSPVSLQTYSTAGTYNYTVPAGVPYITAVIVGAGGGGGAGAKGNSIGGGGGGGGGGYVTCVTFKVTPGDVIPVVVGTGGNGGTGGTSVTDGSAGGTSSVKGIISSGGKGGNKGSGSASGAGGSGADGSAKGGNGGQGSGGDAATNGGAPGSGISLLGALFVGAMNMVTKILWCAGGGGGGGSDDTAAGRVPGTGGTGIIGNGGNGGSGGTNPTVGGNGGNGCGGGGGGANSSTGYAGGSGGAGYVDLYSVLNPFGF